MKCKVFVSFCVRMLRADATSSTQKSPWKKTCYFQVSFIEHVYRCNNRLRGNYPSQSPGIPTPPLNEGRLFSGFYVSLLWTEVLLQAEPWKYDHDRFSLLNEPLASLCWQMLTCWTFNCNTTLSTWRKWLCGPSWKLLIHCIVAAFPRSISSWVHFRYDLWSPSSFPRITLSSLSCRSKIVSSPVSRFLCRTS